VSAFFTPPDLLDLLRSRGHRVVLLHTESPYQEDEQLTRAAHADVSIVNDPTNLDAYRALGPAWWQPHCYRPDIHHPGPPALDLVCDLAFVGTGFASRIRFLEAMDLDGLDVLLAGQWQQLDEASPLRKHLAHDIDRCLDNAEAAKVYRSARTSLNLYRREADRPELATGYAMSPREVEMAACGLWFTRDPRPEGDELFPMLPTFASPEEAGEQVRWALTHAAARDAAAAAREAIADRTFTNAARRLLTLLDR
jgi:spore maturation protein CgeB